MSSGSTGRPSHGIRCTCSDAITRRRRFWIKPYPSRNDSKSSWRVSAVAPDDLDDLVVVAAKQPAADP